MYKFSNGDLLCPSECILSGPSIENFVSLIHRVVVTMNVKAVRINGIKYCSNNYGYVQFSIHNSSKNTNSGGSLPADSRPNINLHRMLEAWFALWLLPIFVATKPAVGFQLHALLFHRTK